MHTASLGFKVALIIFPLLNYCNYYKLKSQVQIIGTKALHCNKNGNNVWRIIDYNTTNNFVGGIKYGYHSQARSCISSQN